MKEESGVLKINIFGTEYPIRSGPETETEYIMRVAEYVDQKMREVDQSTGAKSSLKVAILAALNIADELFQARNSDLGGGQVTDRLVRLSEKLDEAIGSQS